MIDEKILTYIRNGVCAVGALSVDLETYKNNPIERDYYYIEGTGFLIRENTVVTNRHVVQGLRDYLNRKRLPDDNRYCQFAYQTSANQWQTALCGVEFASTVNERQLDIGFIDITRRPETDFAQCQALEVNGDHSLIALSKKVAIFGYPQGNELFVNNTVDSQQIYRFGPVLQQGYVSALAPFAGPPFSRILSDIRTTFNMSGSPVFDPKTGDVLSIHEGSNRVTTAFSIPLHPDELREWLVAHDELRKDLIAEVDVRESSNRHLKNRNPY